MKPRTPIESMAAACRVNVWKKLPLPSAAAVAAMGWSRKEKRGTARLRAAVKAWVAAGG